MNRKYAWVVIIAVFTISIFFITQLSKLQFKYDFELFYPKNDVDTEFFNEFRDKFESDNDFVLIGIVNEDGIFDQAFLKKIESFVEELDSMVLIEDVISITNVESRKILPLYPGIYRKKILRINEPEFYKVDSAKLFGNPNYLHSIVSEDGKSVCIVLRQLDYLEEAACFEISDNISALLSSYDFDETHISGRCLGLSTYVRLIRSELRVFVGSSAALILLFLYISYRKLWGLWMPALVILFTVLWTIGLMSITGKPMDLISNVIPTMLMVIGISNVVHLLSRFLDYLRDGLEKMQALKRAYREVGVATIFTSLTTVIGFLSLTTSNVQPVIDMGLYTAMGLGIAFLLSYTLFPSLIIVQDRLSAQQIGESFWKRYLQVFYIFLSHRKKRILFLWICIVCLSIVGSSRLRVNSFLLDGLQIEHPQRKAFSFFEKHFSGSRPFELSLELLNKDEDAFSLSNLHALDSIHQYLDSVYGVGSINSPLIIIKNLNQTINAGSASFYRIPINQREHKKLMRKLDTYSKKIHLEKYFDDQNYVMRISGKILDEGSIVLNPKDESFYQFIDLHFSDRFLAKLTGAATMMDNTHAYIVRNVIRGLIFAIIIIGMIMGFLFRSSRIVIISLLTNLIPLIITAGIMGFYGIDMRLSTSIIFIIAFGIAVDDSIHFLSKFKREIMLSNSVEEAVQNTFMTTGKAIIVTTLIISGGFFTLAMSSFLGTFYLGLFISVTLFIAMLANLMILPGCLLLFYKK